MADYQTPIRSWSEGRFHLDLYDTGFICPVRSKLALAYNFTYDGEPIFQGDDFYPSPLHAIDSDETVAGLLTFLSLRPGDTDREYFERYTPEQMDFAIQHGEELALYAHELEESR